MSKAKVRRWLERQIEDAACEQQEWSAMLEELEAALARFKKHGTLPRDIRYQFTQDMRRKP